MAPEADDFKIDALWLPRTEWAIIDSWYDSARPWVDLPKLADLYMNGRLKIDAMISRSYRLEVKIAYDALAAGEVARSVNVFDRRVRVYGTLGVGNRDGQVWNCARFELDADTTCLLALRTPSETEFWALTVDPMSQPRQLGLHQTLFPRKQGTLDRE